MKSVLVTGGAGFIGSHVVNLLIDKKYKVTVIDNLVTGNKKLINKKAVFYKCDIEDKKKIINILKKKSFDIVMHFAGLIRVDESIKKPSKYNKFNYLKAKTFINTCIKNNINNIIFSSTATVYGNKFKKKISEEDNLNPINPYAKSKLKLENFLKQLSQRNKINYVILRYFNVAGADEKMRSGLISKYSTHLIKVASEVATNKKKFLIINGNNYNTKDGTTIRDYIHVSDLAEMHIYAANYLLKNKKSNIFNCGYGKGYSVKQIIKTYNKILKNKIKFKIGPKRSGDSKILIANPEKFNQTMNWKPKFDNLEYILKTAYQWEKKLKNF